MSTSPTAPLPSNSAGVKVKCLPQFRQLYDLPPGTNTVVLIGGRGGAKTYEASKFAAFSATVRRKRCVVVRDEKESIRESILNEILLRYDTANASGALAAQFARLDTGIKDVRTGEMMVFTQGFRASSKEKRANLKGVSNVDIALIEEAEDIRDEEKFNTFADSIRKEGALIVIILNTPDINHWIVKRYFTLADVDLSTIWPGSAEKTGYYDIIPKQIPGFVCIKTNFTDNTFLAQTTVESYKQYGDPHSFKFNKHYYLTAILGYASTGRRGQIFSGWKSITNDEFNAIEARSIFGQDFGSTSPAGLVECKIVNNRLYIREQNYRGMTEKQLAYLYCELGLKDEVMIADSAEPMTIRKLRSGWEPKDLTDEERAAFTAAAKEGAEPWKYGQIIKGWNIYGALKPPGSIIAGIKKIMDMEVFATQESTNIWTEYSSYIWATDKNKMPIDEPEDANNHLMDAIRYVVTGQGRFY
jgi:PBSX family phage terminase large subunit